MKGKVSLNNFNNENKRRKSDGKLGEGGMQIIKKEDATLNQRKSDAKLGERGIKIIKKEDATLKNMPVTLNSSSARAASIGVSRIDTANKFKVSNQVNPVSQISSVISENANSNSNKSTTNNTPNKLNSKLDVNFTPKNSSSTLSARGQKLLENQSDTQSIDNSNLNINGKLQKTITLNELNKEDNNNNDLEMIEELNKKIAKLELEKKIMMQVYFYCNSFFIEICCMGKCIK